MVKFHANTSYRLFTFAGLFLPVLFFTLFILFLYQEQGNIAFFFLLVALLFTLFSLIGFIACSYYKKQRQIFIEEQSLENASKTSSSIASPIPDAFIPASPGEIDPANIKWLRTNSV